MARKDTHRPSVINSADYHFISWEMVPVEGGDIMGQVAALRAERLVFAAHQERTGASYSHHEHGGNCGVCGNPNAIYTALFWHKPSNTYVRVGRDCAEKLDNESDFAARYEKLVGAVGAERKFQAGKQKAQALLSGRGLSGLWVIFNSFFAEGEPRGCYVIRDIIGKLVQYGSLSDKQFAFLAKLESDIINAPAIEASRQAARDAAQPVPLTEERIEVVGTVVGFKRYQYDEIPPRMILETQAGYKLMGSIPAGFRDVEKGAKVRFFARVAPSRNDPKFGYYKRPTRAEILGPIAS